MVERFFDRKAELERISGVARPTVQDYFMDAMSVAPVFLGMPPLPPRGRIIKKVARPKKKFRILRDDWPDTFGTGGGEKAGRIQKYSEKGKRWEDVTGTSVSSGKAFGPITETAWEAAERRLKEFRGIEEGTVKRLSTKEPAGIGKLRNILEKEPARPGGRNLREVAKPKVTGKSLADELGISHIGSMEGLEWYNVKVPKGEATIATKGINREELIKKIAKTKKDFAVTSSKPLKMQKIIRRGDPESAFSRGRKLLRMWEKDK